MEHALSDTVQAYLDQYLDFPKQDPHGQPIFRSLEEYRSYREG